MRTPIAALALALGAAHALAQYPSFDLAIVYDHGDRSFKRFDAQSGTFLGSFGRGELTDVKDFAIRQSDFMLVAADKTTDTFGRTVIDYKEFNYMTGVGFGSTFGGNAYDGGNATVAYDSVTNLFVGHYSTTSNRIRFMLSPGFIAITDTSALPDTARESEQGFDSRWHFLNDGRLYNESLSAGLAVANPGGMGQAYGGVLYSFNNNRIAYGYASGSSVFRIDYGTVSAFSSIRDFGGGHRHFYFTGLTSGGQAAIGRLDQSLVTYGGSFGQGYLIDPREIQVMAAPEPGTLAALALGALALLRKRRKPTA